MRTTATGAGMVRNDDRGASVRIVDTFGSVKTVCCGGVASSMVALVLVLALVLALAHPAHAVVAITLIKDDGAGMRHWWSR
ncbi:MAG: hypothetical protein HEQ38_00830 [Gemmatimonas sp.]|nr:hypothetical protein [Gemmatimonas sp.]